MEMKDLLRHISDNMETDTHWSNGLVVEAHWNIYDTIRSYSKVTTKPKTHFVNGYEVPAPMSKKPVYCEEYYFPTFTTESLFYSYSWGHCARDNRLFERGMCFSTPEAAIASAKAMMNINPES